MRILCFPIKKTECSNKREDMVQIILSADIPDRRLGTVQVSLTLTLTAFSESVSPGEM